MPSHSVMVDIDGCLVDFDQCFRTAAEVLLEKKMPVERAYDFSLAKSYNLTQAEVSQVFNSDHVLEKLGSFIPFVPMCDYLKFLVSVGADIFYVTARGTSRKSGVDGFNKTIQTITKDWVASYAPISAPVVFQENKLEFAQAHGIDMAIEDSPVNVSKLSKAGIVVLMPVWDYNIHMVGRKNVLPFDITGHSKADVTYCQ